MKLPKLIKSRIERAEAELSAVLKEAADLSERIDALVDVEATSEDPDEIRRSMGERIAANNRLAKLEIRITSARENVAAAQAAQREALLAKLLADLDGKARNLLDSAKSCRAVFDQYIAAREALAAQSFMRDYASTPIFPNLAGSPLLASDLFTAFAAQLDALAQQRSQLTQPVPVTAPPSPAMPKPTTAAPTPRPEPAVVPPPPPPPRQPICDAPIDGMTCVVFLRSGSEYEGRQFAVGDQAVFPPDIAKRLLENGAADLVDEGAQ